MKLSEIINIIAPHETVEVFSLSRDRRNIVTRDTCGYIIEDLSKGNGPLLSMNVLEIETRCGIIALRVPFMEDVSDGKSHVSATAVLQRWDGDDAYTVKEIEFNAAPAINSLDDEMIKRIESGDPYALDEVYEAAVEFGQVQGHDGPFEVEIDEHELKAYIEARNGGSAEALDPTHYNDGSVDLRIVDFGGSPVAVMCNSAGDGKTIAIDDNFFSPRDLLDAYNGLYPLGHDTDEGKADAAEAFKKWLIATGARAEELED